MIVTGFAGHFPFVNNLDYVQAKAKGKTFTLDMAKSYALAKSTSYKKLKRKISTQKASYQSAVKKIELKRRNQRAFRWSPLLSFKLPTSPDQADEYEYIYKPMQIQSQITASQHELNDCVYEVYQQISVLYVKAYTMQETIDYDQSRLDAMQDSFNKNSARVATGQAKQADVDSMKKSIDTLSKKLASEKRSFESLKSDITRMVKLDVTSGYVFENPYVLGTVSRADLDKIIEHTMKNDQSVFQAKLTSQLAKKAVEIDYGLLQGQWGGKVSRISSYVRTAMAGGEIDEDIFKQQYDALLYDADSKWFRNFKISFLFFSITFPMEWLKGAISGTRYVEDDPYLLYENVLAMSDAFDEEKKTIESVKKSVTTGLETLITKRNTYETLKAQTEESKKQLDQALLKNSLGELEYEDVDTTRKDYEDLQLQMLDALSDYTQEIFTYNRLTCGALDQLTSTGLKLENTVGGDSYLVQDAYEGAYYYIQTLVEDNIFVLTVYIPDDFSIQITDFELWCDGEKIGERTSVLKELSHLGLAKEEVDSAKLRLYNDDKFVDEVEIDPGEYSGPLVINGGYTVESKADTGLIGSFTIDKNQTTGICTIKITPEKDNKNIKYYKIFDANETEILSKEALEITKEFSYLNLLSSDLEQLKIEFYDENKEILYKGYFDIANMQIKKEGE